MILKDILTFWIVLYVVLDRFDLWVGIPYRPAFGTVPKHGFPQVAASQWPD